VAGGPGPAREAARQVPFLEDHVGHGLAAAIDDEAPGPADVPAKIISSFHAAAGPGGRQLAHPS
jgi:hypothetical protein